MNKRIWTVDLTILTLGAACAVLAGMLAAVKPMLLIVVVPVLAVMGLLLFWNVKALRRRMAKLLHGSGEKAQSTFASLAMPVVVVSGGSIVWYNDAFSQDVLGGGDACLVPAGRVMPGLDEKKAAAKEGQPLRFGGRRWTVYGSRASADEALFVAYLVDDTVLKNRADEYLAARPAVLLIAVDTYDEVLKEMKDSDRARIAGEVDYALEQFVGQATGFLRRTSASRYVAVVEERYLSQIIAARFSILDTVRAIGDEQGTVTLSIGVGRGGETLCEGMDMAAQALDMALGRGGDQAAVKTEDGFAFYGGVSRSVEKRSKVKSRIIASALKDLIEQCEEVFIMGHKRSDLDCVGAAVGMLRFCKMCKKPASVVVNRRQSFAANLIREFEKAGFGDDFISPEQAENAITKDTLLIIVDVHMPQMLESNQLYEMAANVVVIDHHRKGVGYIDNSVIFYHEPYASSASELVTELVQYAGGEKEDKMTPLEAQALLAGITLDTRNFALHTGVRTFEAAAYLRRMGAQTQEVKKLFCDTLESYTYKAKLVAAAQVYEGCAISVSDDVPADMMVVVPQAANDLLSISGVEASFVAVDTGSGINVSARSMGDVNVQVIMEQLGGGGHLTMAGAQLREATLKETKQRLMDIIHEYRENQRAEARGAKSRA